MCVWILIHMGEVDGWHAWLVSIVTASKFHPAELQQTKPGPQRGLSADMRTNGGSILTFTCAPDLTRVINIAPNSTNY